MDRGGLQEAPRDDRNWWTSLDEDYWQALMEHGEIVPVTAPPVAPHEAFYLSLGIEPGIHTPTTQTPSDGDNGPDYTDDWQEAKLALDKRDLFDLKVSGANRGGLLVDWNGLQGFVPASHLKDMPRDGDPRDRMSQLTDRIGDQLTVCMIEVDADQQRLVFSERAATADPGAATALLNTLRPGDVSRGTVTNLTTFGAFIDLGGIEGLIHISELSWDRVRHPSDVLHPGQEIDVYVVGVNPEEKRIALSVKRLRPDPWAEVDTHYQVGDIIEGTVTNVVSFGAFVRVEEGLEGLVHISELAEGNFLHPRNVVREGEQVRVRVLNISKNNHRLGLSLRQAQRPKDNASTGSTEYESPA
jgi:small subunit ribosomal protein S1